MAARKAPQPKRSPAALLFTAAFLFLIPAAVITLAVFNLRKTNLLSWLVSAAVIAASLRIGLSFRTK